GFDPEIASHHVRQLSGNDQAQAPTVAGRREKVATIQGGVEQVIALVRLQRAAAVLNSNAQLRIVRRVIHGGDEQDLSFFGLPESILQQIEQSLAQARRVAAYHMRHWWLNKADQLD